jgi:hypothetical protein
MTPRIKEKSAFEKDVSWLEENHYGNLNHEKFSGWVTRMMADNFSEIQARTYVLRKMIDER